MYTIILETALTALFAAAIILAIRLWPTLKGMLPQWAVSVLVLVADILVRWVESKYKDLAGEEKFQMALGKLEGFLATLGIHIDGDIIAAAVEAAWNKMNFEQVLTGQKAVKAAGTGEATEDDE